MKRKFFKKHYKKIDAACMTAGGLTGAGLGAGFGNPITSGAGALFGASEGHKLARSICIGRKKMKR